MRNAKLIECLCSIRDDAVIDLYGLHRSRPVEPHAEQGGGSEDEDGYADHLPKAALMPIQTAPTKPVAITVMTALNV